MTEKKVTDEDEEEEIVIDIDALANIFTQSREETEKKYEQSLTLTRKTFSDGFNELFANFRTVDEEFFEELEETYQPFCYFEKNNIEELNYNLWSDIVSPSVIG